MLHCIIFVAAQHIYRRLGQKETPRVCRGVLADRVSQPVNGN
jgi:hypothetical protein